MVLFKSSKRKRSHLGLYLDDVVERSQEWLVKESGVSRNTVSRLCSDKNYTPHIKTAQAIVKTLRKHGYKVTLSQFFDV